MYVCLMQNKTPSRYSAEYGNISECEGIIFVSAFLVPVLLMVLTVKLFVNTINSPLVFSVVTQFVSRDVQINFVILFIVKVDLTFQSLHFVT